MKKTKRIILLLTVFALLLCACSQSSPAASGGTAPTTSGSTAPARNIRIAYGGNASTTSSYIISVAYGEIINTQVPGVTMTVEETGGGFEVLSQLINGELDGANVSAGPMYEAMNDVGQFVGVANADNFYSWIPMYTSVFQAVVKADSPIQSYADMIGKKVGVDLVGTGSENMHRVMFDLFEMTDKIQTFNVSKGESMDMLKTGELDVAIITTAAPTSVIVEFGTTEKYRIIPFTEAEMDMLIDSELAYTIKGALPGGTYDQVPNDVATPIVYTAALIKKDIDEDAVYEMTKAIWENKERLITAHPSQEYLSPQMIKDVAMLAPYHPGAERYYREQGWL